MRTASSRELLHALREHEVDGDQRERLGRIPATREQDHVFVYADSAVAAARVRDLVGEAMERRGIVGALSVWRWHPIEERWEDAAMPMPATPQERAAEHERLTEAEDEESVRAGYAEWEVRVSLASHHDAIALAERLQGEGVSLQRHWRHVLIGARDEDEAAALVERVRAQAPADSEIVSEGVGRPIWEAMHPFAVFGGIAN